MTNAIVWFAVWLASWFTINTEYVCQCGTDVVGNKHCTCELHIKEGAKP